MLSTDLEQTVVCYQNLSADKNILETKFAVIPHLKRSILSRKKVCHVGFEADLKEYCIF
jgi:hypothetical protein